MCSILTSQAGEEENKKKRAFNYTQPSLRRRGDVKKSLFLSFGFSM